MVFKPLELKDRPAREPTSPLRSWLPDSMHARSRRNDLRRSRRLAKTDVVDAIATARVLLAEPSLGPVQTLETYDPLVAKIEAVLEYRGHWSQPEP